MKTMIFLLCLAGLLFAKSYEISGVSITARIQPDGSMQVTESRTYDFNGQFSFAFRTFPKADDHSFTNIYITENKTQYRQAEEETPGTLKIFEDDNQTKIHWFYNAENEARTFDIHYTVNNIIKKYDDAAVLYFQFISTEWDHPTREVFLKIIPPQGEFAEKPLTWMHAPLHGHVQILENGIITAQCSPLPAHRYFEIRSLYSPAIFPDAPSNYGYIKSQVMQEEKAWAEEANRIRQEELAKQKRRAERQYYGKYIIWAIAFFSLWGWWQLFQKYGKKPTVPRSAKIRGDAPAATPPAELSYLYYGKMISGTAVVSTLLHLAQRKFIKLQEVEKKSRRKKKIEYVWKLDRDFFKQNAADLLPYENDLLAFLFDDLAEGQDEISLKTIQKKSSKFVKFFGKWQKKVTTAAKENGWWDERADKGILWGLGLFFVLAGLTVAAGILVGMMAFVFGITALVILIGSLLMQHRTREGQMLFNEWKAFKQYMQKYEFRNTGFDGLQDNLNTFFVYAPLLGMSTKFYKELAAKIPIDHAPIYLYWYGMHGQHKQFSPETFSQSISSMMVTTTTAMSSATGAGGGASAGGGSGASAGGGGAG